MSNSPDEPTGYRTPPAKSRFTKGQSGNPKGRPRGSASTLPHEAVLGRKATIHENGVARQGTLEQAFLLHMVKQGLKGANPSIADLVSSAIRRAREREELINPSNPPTLIIGLVKPGDCKPLEYLGVVTKYNPFLPTVTVKIDYYFVELAVHRLDRELSIEEQQIVWDATDRPHKVHWPWWWKVDGS